MITLPKDIAEKLPTVMKIPEGTLQFSITFEVNFFDKNLPTGIIFEQVSGSHYFRLERADNSRIKFYRAAPSVGTQMSVADISAVPSAKKAMFFLTWSPREAKLYIGPAGLEGAELIKGESTASDRNFLIDKKGNVNEVGSSGVNIMGVRILEVGEVILAASAYNYWQETKTAISSLLHGQDEVDYLSKTVRANAAFIFLVTGFESYCKTRVYELGQEGVSLSWDKLKAEAEITKDQLLADTASYFQSTEKAKMIWKSLTDILIADLDATAWQVLPRTFKFRHKVAHVSPILGIVNEGISNENPVFSSNEIVSAVAACDSIVEKLHAETLKLR